MQQSNQHIVIDIILKENLGEEAFKVIADLVSKYFPETNVREVKHEQGVDILSSVGKSYYILHYYHFDKYISIDLYISAESFSIEKLSYELKQEIKFFEFKIQELKRLDQVKTNENLNHKYLYALTVLVAMGSILYEFLLAQSLATIMGNTALRYNITIGLFIASMGFGAMFYKKLIKDNIFEGFIRTEFLLSLIGGTAPILVLIADYFAGRISNKLGVSYFSFSIQSSLFIFNHLMIVGIGFLSGLELPLLIDIGKRYNLIKGHKVLAFDYLGTLIGAIIFPVFLLPSFHVFTLGYIISFTNIFASILFYYWTKINKRAWKYTLIFLTFIWLLVILFSSEINGLIVKEFYFGGRV